MNNQEPMVLSPTAMHSPRSRNNAYLPSYLMGDSTTSLQSLKVRQQMNQSQPQAYFNFGPSTNSPKTVITGEKKDKPRAPPLMTLEESFHEYRAKQPNQDICLQTSTQNNDSFSFFSSPRPAPEISNDSRNEDNVSEHWVTVFGFAPDSVPFILQEFGQLGLILKHFMNAEGNWIHLLYENKIQASRALNRNGRVYNGNMMVGVVPCTDKKTMEMYKNRAGQTNNLEGFQMSKNFEDSIPRSLTPNANRKLPQKQTGVFGKAMDLVFGW